MSEYITDNFSYLSEKSNLINSFYKIYKTGNLTLLEEFFILLNNHKINFNSVFEIFFQKKHKGLEGVYNKLM
jgi:hypothetical protein